MTCEVPRVAQSRTVAVPSLLWALGLVSKNAAHVCGLSMQRSGSNVELISSSFPCHSTVNCVVGQQIATLVTCGVLRTDSIGVCLMAAVLFALSILFSDFIHRR